VVVEAEAVDLALLVDVEAVMVSAEDIPRFLLNVNLLHAQSLVISVSRLQHTAYLPAFRVSPPENFTVCGEGEAVMGPTLYLLDLSLAPEEFGAYANWLLYWLTNSPSQCVL